MFYEAVAADDKRSIGMAVSKDGVRDWVRLGRPVLEAGQPGSWDAGGVCSPSVVSMAGALIYTISSQKPGAVRQTCWSPARGRGSHYAISLQSW